MTRDVMHLHETHLSLCLDSVWLGYIYLLLISIWYLVYSVKLQCVYSMLIFFMFIRVFSGTRTHSLAHGGRVTWKPISGGTDQTAASERS